MPLSGNEIREKFLRFFERNGHSIVSSSSLVPHDDPTLLFTNAGMVQFKDVFLGFEKKPFKRATTSQKCVRAGGKHNDLDTVGRTARHHTFFEMLGNFSFGDYFKKDAILFAWKFLTEELNLPKETLWATVYKDDDEAFDLWLELTEVPKERIVRLGEKDNFWSMGDTGPCGPCSEIIVDRGERYSCDAPDCALGKCDCDRWLEIWNLVFMQYNRDEKGAMTPLPKPSIDTGMGLERITSIIQDVSSNYDTDLLNKLISHVEKITNITYQKDGRGFPMRVIADHARSCTFLIADGVLPGNEGRGYVLRRILRRAVRFGKTLGLDRPFLYDFVPVVVELMGNSYPEVAEKQDFIAKVISLEEDRFHLTLHDGIKVAEDLIAKTKQTGNTVLSGHDAFTLYDTYGFPFDLTEDIAEEHSLTVDKEGFNIAMEEQRKRARSARQAKSAWQTGTNLSTLFKDVPASIFEGYGKYASQSHVQAIVIEGGRINEVIEGQEAIIILENTPFYPESGGQIADAGEIVTNHGIAEVISVEKLPDGKILHYITVKQGKIEVNIDVVTKLDLNKRKAIARNHSATHLLHKALRETLGDHVNQAGSFVADDKLRFDFSHFNALTLMEINKIEDIVNAAIRENLSIETIEASYKDAKDMGATALFGEKYGDNVRIVRMSDFSMELCGGTHCHATGEIGLFKIVSESAVGSGLRRIEAITGEGAFNNLRSQSRLIDDIAMLIKSPTADLAQRMQNFLNEQHLLQKENDQLKMQLLRHESDAILEKAINIGDNKVLITEVPVADMDSLRSTADFLRDKLGEGVIVLGGKAEDKVNLFVSVSKSVTNKIHAGNLIKEVAKIVGGGGGGRPDMAQAGGKFPQKLSEALAYAKELVVKLLP